MTYKTNITPGEWDACEGQTEFPIIASKNGIIVSICDCFAGEFEQGDKPGSEFISKAEALANAKAIAALPDMIEALISMLDYCHAGSDKSLIITNALKKAGVEL